MTGASLTDYQATYRRSETAMPSLLAIVALAGIGLAAAILYADGPQIEATVLIVAGATVAAMLFVLANTFRLHRWMLTPDGLSILERPKVPLTGLRRRADISFAAIVALREVESGFDRLIEIVTQDGRRFRMPQTLVKAPGDRLLRPDPQAWLADFAASIRAAATVAGHALPPTSQGMSFWNTVPGLAFVFLLFALSLAISLAVVLALLEGFTTRQPRGGEAMAILLLLPLGAGWLWLKSLRRRRIVLAELRAAAASVPVRR